MASFVTSTYLFIKVDRMSDWVWLIGSIGAYFVFTVWNYLVKKNLQISHIIEALRALKGNDASLDEFLGDIENIDNNHKEV